MTDWYGTHPTGEPGLSVAGLQVLTRIGSGAYAEVYRVRRGTSEYALKVLRQAGMDRGAEATFRREAALLACVDHPGLPRVYEVGAVDDRPYLLMDLVEGYPLTTVLTRGTMPPDRVVALGIDLADALGAAHDAGLVHRDVKPDNIIIGPDGTTRLVDFGLATHASAEWPSGAAGTLVYAAPEQSGILRRPIDGRADLYALGAVLFEASTGSPPFVADDVGELLRMHATAPAPDPRQRRADLSPAFAAIVGKLLAKDPDDRYSSAHGVAADLRRLAEEPDGGDFPVGLADGPDARRDIPLIGRRAQFGSLASRWQRTRTGAGGCALVEGPPGAGKSRMAREVVAVAARSGCLVLQGKGTADQARPLAVVRAAIEGYLGSLRRLPAARREELHQVLRTAGAPAAQLLARLSPDLASVLGVAPTAAEVAQEQFASAIATFLAGLARLSGGGVLCLDDVQWLDDVTRAVLRQLRSVLAGTPLFVLATGRDDPDSAPGMAAFRSAAGEGLDLTVSLQPLNEDEVAALVAAATGGLRVDREAAARLTAHSHGNPFALLEYLKAIVDAGLARPYWGTWQLDHAGLARLDLPADAAALILNRVDALDEESRWLLGVGAVAGAEFTPDLVARVCGVDPQRALDIMTHASWHRLVRDAGEGRYAFVHDRIREALADQFAPDAVRAVHQRIADALAERDRDDPATTYALAHHCLHGEIERDPGRVFRTATAAGRLALADHSPAQAVFFLEQAAAAATTAGITTDAAFLRTLGVAYRRCGRFDDAVGALRAALSGTTGRLERAALLRLIAQVHDNTWNTAAERAAVDEALAELGRALPKNPIRMVVSTLWLVVIGYLVGKTRIGYGTVRGGRRDRHRLLIGLYELHSRRLTRDLRADRALLIGLRGVYYANRVGPSVETAMGKGQRALLCRLMGLRSLADRLDAEGARMAAELADPNLTAHLAWVRGVAMFGSGADNGECALRSMREHVQWMDPGHYLDYFAMLAWDLHLRGDTAGADAWFRRRRARVAASGQLDQVATIPVEAGLPALRGQAAEAAALLDRFRAVPDLPAVTRVDALSATMQSALEQRDLGTVFDDAADEFARLGLTPAGMLPGLHSVYVYQAYGRIEQCRAATGRDRAARLAIAKRAVRQVRRVARRSIVAAHHRVLRAALHELAGEPTRALAVLGRPEPALLAVDAPLVAFEEALVRARSLRALGIAGETRRQAEHAIRIAERHDWPHRARWVRAEFGLDQLSPSLGNAGVAAGVYRRRLAALEQVSLVSSRVLDPDRLARIVLDETVRILGAERALLFLVEGDVGSLRPWIGRDCAGDDLDALGGYSATLVERVRQSREALVVAGTEEGEALGSRSMDLHGLRSIIIAPLCVEDRLLGVVYLDSRLAKGIFTSDDTAILTAIANQVARAMETARAAQLEVAMAAMARQRDLAETMRAAMNEVSGTLDPETVLRRLLDTTFQVSGASRGWLVIRDDASQRLSWLVVPAPGAEATAAAPAAYPNVYPRMITLIDAAEQEIHTNAEGLPAALAERAGTVSGWLTIPLVVRHEPVGTLILATDGADGFGPAQVETAGAIAAQGMVAYENARLFNQARLLATVDSLTQLATRRHFIDAASREIAVAHRQGRALAAIMVDIDHFKKVNDTWGHQVGDDVIRAVAARLRLYTRSVDLAGRYGGEEFALILPDVDGAARATAERLCAEVEATPIDTAAGLVSVTISAGVAYLHATDTDPATLLARADECLYRAKRAGRNRVVVYQDAPYALP